MKHILVIDDDKINLATARRVLMGTYKVTAITSGVQAFTGIYVQRRPRKRNLHAGYR